MKELSGRDEGDNARRREPNGIKLITETEMRGSREGFSCFSVGQRKIFFFNGTVLPDSK